MNKKLPKKKFESKQLFLKANVLLKSNLEKLSFDHMNFANKVANIVRDLPIIDFFQMESSMKVPFLTTNFGKLMRNLPIHPMKIQIFLLVMI